MSMQENKALIKRLYEEPWTERRPVVAAPGYVLHNPAVKRLQTLEEHRDFHAELLRTFPDLQFTVEELIGEGDFVVARWRARGTFTGAYMGIQPTGKVVEVTGINITRFEEGKPREEWMSLDLLGMLQQMGAVPEMAAVPA